MSLTLALALCWIVGGLENEVRAAVTVMIALFFLDPVLQLGLVFWKSWREAEAGS